MKYIELSNGGDVLVDDEDFDFLSQWKWTRNSINGKSYASRRTSRAGGQKPEFFLMHRVIMNLSDSLEVDHRDNDGLNNQRSNLRPATHGENQRNKPIYKNNKLGIKGVCMGPRGKKFLSQIRLDGKGIRLGLFDHIEEAAGIYITAALEYHGEFACV